MAYFDPAEIASFWRALTTTAWGKRPARFEAPFSKRFATPDEYLRILQAWSSKAREGEVPLESAWLQHGAMPAPEDRSLEDFFERVDRNWGKDWFLYVADGLQELDGDLWERAVEIIEPSFAHTGGLPPGGLTLDILVGKYSRTPFGIHLDAADTLALIVKGPKRLLFWPNEAFTAREPHTEDLSHQTAVQKNFEEHKDTAIVIDADAGDVVYWPRSFWHIGSSPQHWTGMTTIGMWWHASPRTALRLLVSELVESVRLPALAYPIDTGSTYGGAGALPPSLEQGLASLRRSFGDDAQRILERYWLQLRTCHGFKTAPASRAPVELLPDTRWIVEHPVVVTAADDVVLVFAAGQQLEMSEGAAARAARVLVRGTRWSLATLFDDARVAAREDDREEICELVTQLHAVRAVNIETHASA